MKLVLALVSFGLVCLAQAKVVLPELFDSHMVLQREAELPVFGKAEAGEKIAVAFAGQLLETTADANGRWRVAFKPLAASAEPRRLTVKGAGNEIVLDDVLVGDVWVCSGQSNMEYSMGWHPLGWEEFQKESVKFPTIRIARSLTGDLEFPNRDSAYSHFFRAHRQPCGWRLANDKDFLLTTAVGYFFARRLTIETGLPIGLVNAAWSAQRIEPFVPQKELMEMTGPVSIADKVKARYPNTPEGAAYANNYLNALEEWIRYVRERTAKGLEVERERPEYRGFTDAWKLRWGTHYNKMVHPLTQLPIKGVIWYQGCANADTGLDYLDFFKALVKGWRRAWRQPELPFYSVQLASFWNNWRKVESVEGGDGFTPVREAQRLSMAIPHTGVAVALDLGEPYEIHPHEKLHVGERLARWALHNEYGRKELVPSGPNFRTQKIEGNAIRLSFDYVGSGLMVGEKSNADLKDPVEAPKGTKLVGFAIKSKDGSWHAAEAKIDGETVVVSSPEVAHPVAVRYAYHGSAIGAANLYNRDGLPAFSFKTDD